MPAAEGDRGRHPTDKDSASPDAWPAFHGYGVSGECPARSFT